MKNLLISSLVGALTLMATWASASEHEWDAIAADMAVLESKYASLIKIVNL